MEEDMIPQVGLDDETFSGIIEKALREIPGLYPEWTDYNAHDPGITLLELIAWQKEMQQFHLDQIGEAHLRGYLNLMGITPRGICPAEAVLSLDDLSELTFFPKGSRFFADDICFETTDVRWIDTTKVIRLASLKTNHGPGQNMREETAVTKKKLRFPAFGMHPSPEDTLEIILSGPLTPCVRHSLYLHFFSDTVTKRNPITDDSFIPLAEYTLSYLTAEGKKTAVICKDTTHEMLQNGFLTFFTEKAMTPGEDGLYRLSLTLTRCDYDMPPVIEEISLQCLKVKQTCTLAENHTVTLTTEEYFVIRTRLAYEGDALLFREHEGRFYPYNGPVCKKKGREGVMFCFPGILKEKKDSILSCRLILYDQTCRDRMVPGEGTGMPWEEYPSEIPYLMRRGLRIMVEDAHHPEPYFQFFEETADFTAHGPEDLVFHLDEKTGIFLFGDCDHGTAPEGKILITAALTSRGAKGNVKAGSICRTETLPCLSGKQLTVTNHREAVGGEDMEETEECINRFLQEEPDRAVTYRDYETLLRQTPGLLIENVKVIPVTECSMPGDKTVTGNVTIVVKPRSIEREPKLSGPFRQNLLRTLNPRRMIGTKIVILSPEYVGVTIFAEIKTTAGPTAARKQIHQTLTDYFLRIQALSVTRISHSDIYGTIDVLDCVSEIRSFGMDAHGKEKGRSKTGDILLPVNGLPYLKECHLIVSFVTDST